MDYSNFWAYWRALYKEGFKFENDHPEMSNFMFAFYDMATPPFKRHVFDHAEKQINWARFNDPIRS
jgi:hypothetical protein